MPRAEPWWRVSATRGMRIACRCGQFRGSAGLDEPGPGVLGCRETKGEGPCRFFPFSRPGSPRGAVTAISHRAGFSGQYPGACVRT